MLPPKMPEPNHLPPTEEFGVHKLGCSSQKPHHLRAVFEITENRVSLALIGKNQSTFRQQWMQMDQHLPLKTLPPRPVPPVVSP